MTFYTIQSPGNRNEEVKKYLALKGYLRDRDRAEQMGEVTRAEELAKFFKPVSQPIQKLTGKVESLPAAISQALPALPGLPGLPAPGLPPIEEEKGKIEVAGDEELTKYLEKLTTNRLKTLISIKEGVLNIGEKNLTIGQNNIKYGGKTYKRTPELLDLIFSDTPAETSIDNEKAKSDYEKILLDSGVLFSKTGKTANQKLTGSEKWKKLLKPMYDKIKPKTPKAKKRQEDPKKEEPKTSTGKGHKTVFLSSNPVALANRLTLLCGSAQAGNTGLKNEMVEICKELIRMKVMTRKQKEKLLNGL